MADEVTDDAVSRRDLVRKHRGVHLEDPVRPQRFFGTLEFTLGIRRDDRGRRSHLWLFGGWWPNLSEACDSIERMFETIIQDDGPIHTDLDTLVGVMHLDALAFEMEAHERARILEDDEVSGDRPDSLSELDDMAPGIMLAAALSRIDVHSLSPHDRVIVLRAHQRMTSHHTAKLYEAMGAITDSFAEESDRLSDDPEVCEGAAAEIRVALRWTRRATDRELSVALALRRRLPVVFDRFASGAIDVRRAKVFDHGTLDLPISTAQTIADRLIDEAPGLTPGELAAKIRRLRAEAEPEGALRRLERSHAERRVILETTPDGTADLHAFGIRPDKAAALMSCLHRTALAHKRDGDERTMDQLRADVLVDLPDLASADDRSAARSVITLHVDLPTLAHMNNTAGDLNGYGPIVADIARQLTERHGDAIWEYSVTDDASGMPLDMGTTRRRPTTGQQRMVRSRDRRCIFPGCRMPATDSDLDHTQPWSEGGATTIDNLAPLCRHDHLIRHRDQWRYTRLGDGDYTWLSPTGHTYTTSGRSP